MEEGWKFESLKVESMKAESRKALPKNGAYNIRQLLSDLSARTSGLDYGGGLEV